MKLEDRGMSALSSVDEGKIMMDAGLFGVHMFVAGLGLLALSPHREAGTALMKVGGVLGIAMYGAKYLATK